MECDHHNNDSMDLFTYAEQPVQATAPQAAEVPPVRIAYRPATTQEYRNGSQREAIFAAKAAREYATAKKSNHSTAPIPQVIVDEVERGEPTLEMIQTLAHGHPIYVYQTCLTVHGAWPKVQQQYAFGYKHLRQNQNGSMEILWPAVDGTKKREVARALKAVGSKLFYEANSSSTRFVENVAIATEEQWNSTVERLQRIAGRVRNSGAYATATVYRWVSWGGLYLTLDVNVQAIPQEHVNRFVLALADMDTQEQYEQAAREHHLKEQREEKERQERQRIADAEREVERAAKAKAQAEQDKVDGPWQRTWMDENTRLDAPDTPTVGATYARAVRNRHGKLDVQTMHVERGSFGRYKLAMNTIQAPDNRPVKQRSPEEMKAKYRWPDGWRLMK